MFLKYLAAILICAAIFTGCNNRHGPRQGYTYTTTANVFVSYPWDASTEDIRKYNRSIEVVVQAWEAKFGKPTRRVDIVILDVPLFCCGDATNAIGCYHGYGNITVVAGPNKTLPALFHELCHRNEVSLYAIDVYHADPLWATWEAWAATIDEELKKEFANE